jgi:2-oxoglutarate ferredoxin oxidoreductase subunit beta
VLAMALAAGATFVAQGYSRDLNELTALLEQGIRHKGFSLINIFSPCVTFNKVNTYEWFSEHLIGVEHIKDYDAGNRAVAMEKIMAHDGLLTGLLYQDSSKPSYQELLAGYSKKPLTTANLELGQAEFERLTAAFY